MSGHVFTFGETMGLYRATELGSLETVTDAKIGIGGADSNVAIGLQRLGIDAIWTGRVGDDGLGRRIVRELRAEGISVKATVDPHAPTGVMLKEKTTAETTRVYFYRRDSAGSRVSPTDLDEHLIRSAALLHVTGITALISSSGRETVYTAIDIARDAGVPVSFDVNHRPSLVQPTDDPGAIYRHIATRSDILFAGEEEARLIATAPCDVPGLAAQLADLGPVEVIIKLGAEGSAGIAAGKVFHRDALPIRVVDSVGAGDAFVAGYLAARLQGLDIGQRTTLATTAGAFACLGPGDWESLPRPADLRLLSGGEPVTR